MSFLEPPDRPQKLLFNYVESHKLTGTKKESRKCMKDYSTLSIMQGMKMKATFTYKTSKRFINIIKLTHDA